ncbi:MAG TPA: hypothetical protein PKD09_15925 [Aggregatilinea sp.]|uniref:hypothetical protein n=1 Tax=Aggregatilinea sp. TaxID=2806333 RepID=UPI002C6886BF|nr:hypothetical protein [Aggregatilinea sp.]HML23142.1 hypothetical protein [Aggregatilinea sp.]
MKFRRLKWVGVSLFILMLVGTNLIPPAHAQEAVLEFTSVSASCMEGAYTLHGEEILFGFSPFGLQLAAAQPASSYFVEARDADGTFLGSSGGPFDPFMTADYSGTIAFLSEPTGPTVTFYLYYDAVIPLSAPSLFGGLGSAHAQSDPTEANDTMPADYTPCAAPGTPITSAPLLPAPGCDLVDLTGAVVGRFITSTHAYYAPSLNALTYPVISIKENETLWVFGQDSTHAFYKVLLGCSKLWVPVASMAPDYAYPWYGTPLPTTVVK